MDGYIIPKRGEGGGVDANVSEQTYWVFVKEEHTTSIYIVQVCHTPSEYRSIFGSSRLSKIRAKRTARSYRCCRCSDIVALFESFGVKPEARLGIFLFYLRCNYYSYYGSNTY